MKGFWAVVGACLLSSGGLAQDTGTPPANGAPGMVVYDTALENGWQSWSWAKVASSVDIPGSVRKPMRVDAGPWAAVALHHDTIDLSPYKTLKFLVHGMGQNPHLAVFMLANGKALATAGYPVTINSNGWVQVEIPLATLGAAKNAIDQIQIQNASDQQAPTFLVTEVGLY